MRSDTDIAKPTEWHRVVFYDRPAEIVGEYLKKEHSYYVDNVEGRLKTRKWTDKDGVEEIDYTLDVLEQHQLELVLTREAEVPAARSSSVEKSLSGAACKGPAPQVAHSISTGFPSQCPVTPGWAGHTLMFVHTVLQHLQGTALK